MATNNMNNLTTLIKRLEAATTRLEDIASSTIELPQAVPALSQTVTSPPSASQSSTPAPSTSRAASAPSKPAPAAQPESLPESVEEFDTFIAKSVENYHRLSNKIGGHVAQQADKVLEGFVQQRKFLLLSTKAKKPAPDVLQLLLQPTTDAMLEVGQVKDSNRGNPNFDHLSAVAEGIMVFAWVTLENKPFKHVEDSLGSAQFFGNRVLKEYKEKDAQHVDWIQSYYQIFRDLTDYVKQHFSNGLPWNPKGDAAEQVAKAMSGSSAPAAAPSAPPAPAPAAGGAPPPPPPPPGPPPVLQVKDSLDAAPASSSGASGLGAVFSELNKGEAVTAGLRKVDRSEMTHKNPSLRAGATVGDGASAAARGKSPAPARKPKPESMRTRKPPKKELDGNKWTLENFDKEDAPIKIDASLSHSILISKVNSSTVIVSGKANNITVENTSRLSLVVDSLVSTVDVVKSSNFALQVMGSIPTLMMDQVDEGTVYLSKESIATRVFTSKSSGVNLNVLAGSGGEDDDYKELPLPYQICSYYDEGRSGLVNEIVDHAG